MRPLYLTFPIRLHPKQAEVEASPARFKIAKWGRRSGKSRYGAYWMVKQAVLNPGLHWHVNKNLDLVRDEVWPHLVGFVPRQFLKKVDAVRLRIDLRTPNGPSRIVCKSGEKEDNLRGRGLRSLWVDEASFMRQTLWDNVLRATLADYEAPALITSSPRRGWFTAQFDKAAKGRLRNWAAFHATIYDNPYISRTEIEEIRGSTPENVWLQEYMAHEVENSGVVFAEFDERNIFNPARDYPSLHEFPCAVGADYGLADPTGVAWCHVAPDGPLLFAAERVMSGLDVALIVESVHSVSAGRRIDPADYILDTVNFRREGSSGGKSIADKFAALDLRFSRSEKGNDNMFDLMKRLMRGNQERPFWRVSVNCPQLIDACRTWEHGEHEPDILAAARYVTNHIIKKKMSPLAELLPRMDGYAMRNQTGPAPVGPGRVMLPRLARGPQPREFQWDFESGVFA